MSEAKVNLEFEGPDAYICVICPKCDKKTSRALRGLQAGTEIACACGEFVATIKNDVLQDMQKQIDSIGRPPRYGGVLE